MTAVRYRERDHNLPAPLASLVGREAEAAALRDRLLLPDVRLLTLTGPSGTGKTRLALHVAANLLDRFRDGVWLVELATQPDASLVVPAVARTLGLKESADQQLATTLMAFLRDTQLSLVLDNFEHVVAAAPEVAALLEIASGLKLLVTSRTPLGVYGEHVFPVHPLTLPDLSRLPPPETLVENEAVALFLQRARAAHAGFHPTELDLAAIAEVCVRLDWAGRVRR